MSVWTPRRSSWEDVLRDVLDRLRSRTAQSTLSPEERVIDWDTYDDCMMCGAPRQTPCRDQRWHWKYHGAYRACRFPHPRRGRLQ